MDAWAENLVAVWTENRVTVAETILSAIKSNPYLPVKDYSLDDIQQIFDGTLAMMAERMSGQGNEIWDTYMETVIPGLLFQGQPVSALVGQVTMNGMLLHQLLVPLAEEQHRPKISEFLINWFVNVNTEIVKIGVKCGVAN